jgi:adenosylcobyric acid synthase
MGFAEVVDCPVIIVADIDRGGVFAHLCRHARTALAERTGARQGLRHQPLSRRHRPARIRLTWLEERTGKPVLGVLPYLHGLYLDAEDALPRERRKPRRRTALKVIAPAYPRISNHNDLDPLRFHPDVDFASSARTMRRRRAT